MEFSDGYEGVTHAGIAVVAADTGRVLLAQRSYDETDAEDVRETYEFPGGSLTGGEEPLAGATREFFEETGLDLPVGEVVNGWRAGPDENYQGFVYLIDTEFGLGGWIPTAEVQNLAWVSPGEADSYALRAEMRDFDWDLVKVSGNEDDMDQQIAAATQVGTAEEYLRVDDETGDEIGRVEVTDEPEINALSMMPGTIYVHGILAPENTESGDARGFNSGALTKRPLRLPLGWQKFTANAHDRAVTVGSIDRMMRKNGQIHWEGTLLDSDEADEFAGLLAHFGRYGVSIDGDRGSLDAARSESQGGSWFAGARISGAVAVSIPAFAEAYVALGPHPEMPEGEDDSVMTAGARVAFDRGPGWVTHPTETRRLHAYWTEKGQPGYAKIAWGTPGDFRRARALIGEKIAKNSPTDLRYINQIAAQWHFDALGYWPGDLGKPGNAPDTPENRKRAAIHAGVDEPAWEVVLTSSAGVRALPPMSYFDRHPDSGALVIEDPDEFGIRRTYGYAGEWGVCFAGETEYLTESGTRTLKETVGTTQRVLASQVAPGVSRSRSEMEFGGTWVDAEIRSFGVHPLMKVTLRRFGQTKEVFATANHRWLVAPARGSKNQTKRIVDTQDLMADSRLAPLYPKRVVNIRKGVRPSQFGVAHGFTFGDGTRHRDGCRVDLFGDKDKALEPYFALTTSWPRINPNGVEFTRVNNLPAFFKDLPSRGESLSYLYGWLAGYFAADGTVSPDGTPILFSATRAHLEFVEDVCLRLGIATTGIRAFERTGAGEYLGVQGQVNNTRASTLYRLTFMAQTLSEEFFIGAEHRRRFTARSEGSNLYTAWHVVSVEETDRVEEVFCAVVPELENFTLAGNINVMNCHIGYDGRCVEVPSDETGSYAEFHLGRTRTAEGYLATGLITYKVEHRDAATILAQSAQKAHYDDINNAWAAVRLGEDERGVWFSGVVLPHVPEDDLVLIEASGQVSGEWKYGALRTLLTVGVPGFPVMRASAEFTEDGEVAALAASAFDTGECAPDHLEKFAALKKIDAEVRFAALKSQWGA